jgi:hypothetical protein
MRPTGGRKTRPDKKKGKAISLKLRNQKADQKRKQMEEAKLRT